MTTLHATNAFNAIATVNQHLNVTLAAISRPSCLPSYTTVFTWPEKGITPPAISVHHRALYDNGKFQGRVVGLGETGVVSHNICELNAWVSRGDASWQAQLFTFQAMIRKCFIDTTTLIIQDYTTPGSPTATTYKVNIMGLEGLEVAPDPNPDIERARFLMRYNWTQRS